MQKSELSGKKHLSSKDKTRLLEAEGTNLEGKQILLTNTKLLKDYKQTSTSHMLSLKVENNEKCLGQWWEGLENEVYRGVKV